MGYTAGNRRRDGAVRARAARKLGTVRRSQLVTTYGVGSLIAIDNESFIVSGLDSWDVSDAPEIHERRLASMLGVEFFRLPPASEPDDATDGVRVRRFPDFYSCPGCHALQPYLRFNPPPRKAMCGDCDEALVPSRFVLTCEHGHIEDFPYWKWVHRGKGVADRCGGQLRLRSGGASASLRSVVIECSCGAYSSMEGAFRKKSLKDLGIRCSGRSPWLAGDERETCDQPPRTMQRGSSSVWNPVMGSALSIPPFSEGVHALVERHRLLDASDETIRWFCDKNSAVLRQASTTVDDVLRVVHELRSAWEQDNGADEPEVASLGSLRAQEYRSLLAGSREKASAAWQSFVCEPPETDLDPVRELGLQDCMLVKRLREVRALSGFTRGATPDEGDAEVRHALLHRSPDIDWLPAIEVSGEGVFLRLDIDALRAWESKSDVRRRVKTIRDNHLRVLREKVSRDPVKRVEDVTSPVTPRFVLLHTLAHVLINEWSLDGGYPAAALRERLYSGPDMAGVLLYTATSDSAGSLGGVVAQGEPISLARSLRSALLRAAWCSNDPLCMESGGSGVDGVNLAACHACVLLPETSCENNNCFLDRALLVGEPSDDSFAYFVQAAKVLR
ncbi:DrmB family protein [Actinophytocola sp. NPDC049390]|uniref:DrmB family protein n=1 Tax=Actinophytocola sp. NPDC049390 TaxID=3363894 RepID=UPI00378AF9D8